ncbi:hypothetical protein R50073_35930 [Maricurvus nonylphenolicus]
MVEFALLAPIFMVLLLGVFELVRGLQANNIIVNISREGANLVTRTPQDPQDIMTALANTADPLDMGEHGMLMVTVLEGQDDGSIQATSQFRYNASTFDPDSQVWDGCSSWAGDGECTGGLPADLDNDTINDIFWTGTSGDPLAEGEIAYAFEAFYEFDPVFPIPFNTDEPLEFHSLSLF